MNVFFRRAKVLVFILAFTVPSVMALASSPDNAYVNAIVPASVVSPFGTYLEQKLTANDGKTYDALGRSAAISGNVAFIGQHGLDGQSAVYVFAQQPDGSWKQTQKLTPHDGATGGGIPNGGGGGSRSDFGISIAASGATVVIGDDGATINGNRLQGAAYVFTNENGTWKQIARLTASEGTAFELFGASVAVEGSTIMVGALVNVDGSQYQGAVYVFTKQGNTWTQAQRLTASDGAAFGFFGVGGNIAIDGKTAFIGATPSLPSGFPKSGAVYVFTESDGAWNQTQKISAPSDAGEQNDFGIGVRASGNILLVGADSTNGMVVQSAAWLFTASNGIWTKTQQLIRNGNTSIVGLAISRNTALIGFPAKTVDGDGKRGEVYVFKDSSNGTWRPSTPLVASDGSWYDQYGESAAISDKGTIVIGSYATIGDNYQQGAVYFYEPADLGLAVDASETVEPGQNYLSQVITTNKASAASPPVSLVIPVPFEASFVSASATQGDCGLTAGTVTCDFGKIAGNAGTATANITLKNQHIAPGTIENTASVAKATPALTASAATAVVARNPPVAKDGGLSVEKNESASGALTATDPDGDPLTFSIVVQPPNGKVTLTDASKGTYTYTPDKGFKGNDSFAFTASDGQATSNVATVSVTVKAASSGGGGGSTGLTVLFALLGLVLVSAGIRSVRRSN